MAVTINRKDWILEGIHSAIQKKIVEVAAEQIKIAQENIDREVRKELDKIALSLFSDYSMTRNGKDLTIIVKKEIGHV